MTMTFKEAAARYRAEIAILNAPGTRVAKHGHLNYWESVFGDTPLTEITTGRISDARNALSVCATHQSERMSPSTVRRYLATLQHLFSIAIVDWEAMTDNPVQRVRKPKEARGRIRFLTPKERDRLLRVCDRSDCEHLALLVELAVATGMRRGELLRLKWQNLDWNVNLPTSSKTVMPFVRFHVELSKSMARHITTPESYLPRLVAKRADRGRLFPSRFPREAWGRALRVAGLTDIVFHHLRHTCASYLAMSGASPREIAGYLGHNSLAMAMRYQHLSPEHGATVASRAAGYFGG